MTPWFEVLMTKEYKAIVDAPTREDAESDTFEHTWKETGRDSVEARELTPAEAAEQPWPTDYPTDPTSQTPRQSAPRAE